MKYIKKFNEGQSDVLEEVREIVISHLILLEENGYDLKIQCPVDLDLDSPGGHWSEEHISICIERGDYFEWVDTKDYILRCIEELVEEGYVVVDIPTWMYSGGEGNSEHHLTINEVRNLPDNLRFSLFEIIVERFYNY